VGDEVGLGKTLTAIISVMEAIRLGSAHKAMFAVPNHLTVQWQDAFLLAYPNARVLCAGKDDLKKKNRQTFMSRIATGKWDAIIVPQSSFKLLPVNADTLNSFIEAELDELKAFLQQLKADRGYDQRARKELEKAIKRFEAKLVNKSDMAKDSTDTITWDKLGIDMLVVDEFNAYKNLFFHTKMTRIAGLPNTDSQRAFDMFVKVRSLLQKQGHFIGLTGTPISNTMAEAFTLLRYFAYDMLEDMGLSHFDSWAQMFADAVMMPEMTPDGAGFRVNTRLARFTNIPELAGMLSQFMIMRRFKEVSEQVDRPDLYGGKPSSVLMPGSKALKAYVNYLAERAEAVRGGKVDPRDDNLLKIISEGRKAALDLRLLFPAAPDLATSKINTSAWVIAEIYKRTAVYSRPSSPELNAVSRGTSLSPMNGTRCPELPSTTGQVASLPVPSDRVLETVVAPEDFSADGERRSAEDSALHRLLGVLTKASLTLRGLCSFEPRFGRFPYDGEKIGQNLGL
jgi:N12 class adenine-specific DNA methylase